MMAHSCSSVSWGSVHPLDTAESSMRLPFFSSCLSPKYFKMVPGEGMPLPENPTKKGDLFIFFDIQFPTRLTPQKKQMLRQALLT